MAIISMSVVSAITGCLAGVYYGIPRKFIRKANTFFVEQYDYDLIKVINKFERKYPTKKTRLLIKFKK